MLRIPPSYCLIVLVRFTSEFRLEFAELTTVGGAFFSCCHVPALTSGQTTARRRGAVLEASSENEFSGKCAVALLEAALDVDSSGRLV